LTDPNRTLCYPTPSQDIVLKDLENQGVDFWWIDWQQGGQQGGCTGGKQNPTIWTDKTRATGKVSLVYYCSNSNISLDLQGLNASNWCFIRVCSAADHLRRGENVRGMVLARWGGLGNHRYQVGFSGDVADVSWYVFQFQPARKCYL